ncbi:hypothetical protein BDZ91DRAFT_391387 [Kalaharituber pfeilii]|nr:hypothetical protein BDZ91DRAFT_391387 [Kalaharituber pfeilii]
MRTISYRSAWGEATPILLHLPLSTASFNISTPRAFTASPNAPTSAVTPVAFPTASPTDSFYTSASNANKLIFPPLYPDYPTSTDKELFPGWHYLDVHKPIATIV